MASIDLDRQLQALRKAFARTAPAGRVALHESKLEELRSALARHAALKEGDRAPDFSLPDAQGSTVRDVSALRLGIGAGGVKPMGLIALMTAAAMWAVYTLLFRCGVLMSGVAIVAFNRSVALLGPSAATAIIAPIPVAASLAAIPVLGELPSDGECVALAVVVGGVLLAANPARKAAKPSISPTTRPTP